MKKLKEKAQVLTEKRAEFYIDKAIGIIIAVVVGTLLLGGIYSLFNGTVLPGLAERISGMFS